MWMRVALIAAVAGSLSALYSSGFIDVISDPERARAALESLGIWAPILYVVAFACLEPFFIPGLAFMIPGGIVFSASELFVLSWLGSIGAGIVGFGFARFLARDFVESRLPERLRRFDDRLASQGLRTVIGVRLTLFLAPPAHWLLGLSKVRFAPFVLGTAIGFVPGIALASYLVVFVGESIGDWIANRPPGTFALLALVIVVIVRIRRRRAKQREPEPDAPGATPRGEADVSAP